MNAMQHTRDALPRRTLRDKDKLTSQMIFHWIPATLNKEAKVVL